MKADSQKRLAELIEKQISGTLNETERAELEVQLIRSEDARKLFLDLTSQHAHLQSLRDSLTIKELQSSRRSMGKWTTWSLVAAAVLLLGAIFWTQSVQHPVATLISSEHAAWESALPTTPGSELVPGVMHLKSGVATIRFSKGAEVTMEAPATLELETSMRGRLHKGNVVVDVPESAVGFVMETIDSYAVDYGTQFAISINEDGKQSFFEVLSGEISVHHFTSDQALRLRDGEAVISTASGIEPQDRHSELGHLPEHTASWVFESQGREASSVRNDDTTRLHPHFLMAKRTASLEEFDRRSVFGFSMQGVERLSVESARIRLNLVPCGLGFAARLPTVSRFAIYGIPAKDAPSYPSHLLPWQSLPQPEPGFLLGRFELSRGGPSTSVLFESEALVQFLRNAETETVDFLLVRETDEDQLGGLVHAFASSKHPTVSGPSLEMNW